MTPALPERPDCPFCRERDAWLEQSGEVKEGERMACFSLSPLNPTHPGHWLVIPARHVESLAELEPYESAECLRLIAHIAKDFRDFYLIQQNGPTAQQTISHVHFHVVPAHAGFRIPWNEAPNPCQGRCEFHGKLWCQETGRPCYAFVVEENRDV